jgi:hypothetical protein
MVREARFEELDSGLAPVTDGWFVVNVRDAAWETNDQLSRSLSARRAPSWRPPLHCSFRCSERAVAGVRLVDPSRCAAGTSETTTVTQALLLPVARRNGARLLPRERAICAYQDNGRCQLARSFTGATGLEPATSGVTGRRSNQLNYAPARMAGRL